jgi:hypothetical protein
MTVSCYYRLNPWSVSADLGRRYGVPVYAGLSEARVQMSHKKDHEPVRRTVEAYRARALNAWQDGVDGIYFFNLFNPNLPIFREAGDPAALSRGNRVYFASVRSVGGSHWRFPNVHLYRRTPILSPEKASGSPMPIRREPVEICFDAAGAIPTGSQVQLRFRFTGITERRHVAVRWNGRWLSGGEVGGEQLRFPLVPSEVRARGNTAAVMLDRGDASATWDDVQVWIATQGSIEQMEAGLTPLTVG